MCLTGCAAGGSSDGSTSGDVVKLGASLPLTGSLASFGPVFQDGYQAAVDEVNKAGGVTVDGKKEQVQLVVLDSTSDANTVADQTRTLVLQDGVAGLLGSVSPALTIPASNTADLEKVPLVSTLTPVGAWKAGNANGWQYAWDLFFDEAAQIQDLFPTADLTPTNKKVALFTDTEEDGIAQGALMEKEAPAAGYDVVYRAQFPVGTTDFSEYVNAAKAAGADVVIAQMIPPDSFALWKQMKALAFAPKVAFCEKCASQAAFQKQLGPLAEGTSTSLIASDPSSPEQQALTTRFSPKYGQTTDLNSVMAAYSAAKILLDAINTAGSTDGAKINDAISKTDSQYPIGTVKFDSTHAYAVPPATFQWQGDKQIQISPKSPTSGTLQAPVSGLQ
ncbi:amino acid ABC transporter substrate-binding protein [Subtercola boreus]|nr:amino acid ABC transporter substrate-binding protein [Subtercola boreus]